MHLETIWPLIIRCGDFFVGGSSWFRHQQKFPQAKLMDFLGNCIERVRAGDVEVQRFLHHLIRLFLRSVSENSGRSTARKV